MSVSRFEAGMEQTKKPVTTKGYEKVLRKAQPGGRVHLHWPICIGFENALSPEQIKETTEFFNEKMASFAFEYDIYLFAASNEALRDWIQANQQMLRLPLFNGHVMAVDVLHKKAEWKDAELRYKKSEEAHMDMLDADPRFKRQMESCFQRLVAKGIVKDSVNEVRDHLEMEGIFRLFITPKVIEDKSVHDASISIMFSNHIEKNPLWDIVGKFSSEMRADSGRYVEWIFNADEVAEEMRHIRSRSRSNSNSEPMEVDESADDMDRIRSNALKGALLELAKKKDIEGVRTLWAGTAEDKRQPREHLSSSPPKLSPPRSRSAVNFSLSSSPSSSGLSPASSSSSSPEKANKGKRPLVNEGVCRELFTEFGEEGDVSPVTGSPSSSPPQDTRSPAEGLSPRSSERMIFAGNSITMYGRQGTVVPRVTDMEVDEQQKQVQTIARSISPGITAP